jgi:hypothetical protein
MNQKQREYLLNIIEKQYQSEREKLRSRRPSEPSANNYLVAAILDGSFKMKSEETIREAVKKRVRDLGKGEALVESSSRFYRSDEEDIDVVKLPIEVLFEAPQGYADSYDEYQKALEKWQAEADALDSAINAMRLKVQIGSDKALETLIDQADKLCSMSLTASTKLLLK